MPCRSGTSRGGRAMSDVFAPLRRRVILDGLESEPRYCLSHEMLQRLLVAQQHSVSLEQVGRDAAWLEQEALVEGGGDPGQPLARLTRAGLDVARGHGRHPGVDRPLQ